MSQVHGSPNGALRWQRQQGDFQFAEGASTLFLVQVPDAVPVFRQVRRLQRIQAIK
jgi:hypothetical protein